MISFDVISLFIVINDGPSVPDPCERGALLDKDRARKRRGKELSQVLPRGALGKFSVAILDPNKASFLFIYTEMCFCDA